jgi:hypothetical protein
VRSAQSVAARPCDCWMFPRSSMIRPDAASDKTQLRGAPSRIMKVPTITSTALARNGCLQPQLVNCASSSLASTKNETVPIANPSGNPICTMLPWKPGRCGGECPMTINTAPPHSPPPQCLAPIGRRPGRTITCSFISLKLLGFLPWIRSRNATRKEITTSRMNFRAKFCPGDTS